MQHTQSATSIKNTPQNMLKKKLLEMNDNNEFPFILREEGNDVVASWNILDAKWSAFFGKGGLKKQLELRLIFDDIKKTVNYKEKSSDIEWDASAGAFKFEKSVHYGKRLEFGAGSSWGRKEDGTLGKTDSYKFNTSEITDPIFEVIKNSGWKINLSILDNKRSRKKIIYTVIPLVVVAIIALSIVLFSSMSSVKDAARAEIDLLRSGNIIEAYQASSSELKDRINGAGFEQVIQSEEYSNIQEYGFNNISINDGQAKLAGSVTYRDGTGGEVVILMIKENDQWKLSSIKLL